VLDQGVFSCEDPPIGIEGQEAAFHLIQRNAHPAFYFADVLVETTSQGTLTFGRASKTIPK